MPAAGDPIPALGSVPLSSVLGRQPAISKSAGQTGRFVATWLEPSMVVALAFDRDGLALGPFDVVDSSLTIGFGHPAVDGDGTSFMVAYERENLSNWGEVYCRGYRIDSGSGALVPTSPARSVGARRGDMLTPAVGMLGPKFALSFGISLHFLQSSLEIVSRCLSTCGVAGTSFYQFAAGNLAKPDIASRLSGGEFDNDEALVVWEEGSGIPPFDGTIMGVRWRAFGDGFSPNNLGGGISGGGTAGMDGPFVVANSDFAFTLSGVDPAAAGYIFNFGLPQPTPFPCGAGALSPFRLLIPGGVVNGSARLPFPIPCDEALHLLTLEVQWIVGLTSAAFPTTCISQVSYSDRLRVTVGF